MAKRRIGVLASGEGTTFEAVKNASDRDTDLDYEIAFVVCNNGENNAGIWRRAQKYGVDIHHVSNLTQATRTVPMLGQSEISGTISYEASEELSRLAGEYDIKMYAALGFMKRMIGTVLDQVPVLNLHQGPLGPNRVTAGLHTDSIQEEVMKLGLRYSGPTMHWMAVSNGSDEVPAYDMGEEVGHEPIAVTSAMQKEWVNSGGITLLQKEVMRHEKIWVPIWIADALDQLQ